MSKASILEFLAKAADAVKAVSPIATALGVPFVEKIASWADDAANIAKNAVERAAEAKIALSTDDVNEINARIAELDAVNNKLADYIANS